MNDADAAGDHQLLSSGAQRLAAAGVAQPERDAARLLDRARTLDDPETTHQAFDRMITERARHVPLEYLEGIATFMDREFAVDLRVQVPRPVMKDVVAISAALVRRLAAASASASVPVVDVGTGSGALAVALALSEPVAAPIYATDLSADALEVARVNVKDAGLHERIILRQSNLLDPVPEPISLVMANLPFVRQDMREMLEPGVAEYEPSMAVFGTGESGWGLQRELIEQASRRAQPPQAVVVTFHVSQQEEARALAAANFVGHETSVRELRTSWSGLLVITEPIG